ncbi:Oligopeptide transport system permease protein OppC [subsurface metagenome]
MADSSSGGVAEKKSHSWLVGFFIRLVKEKPLGMVGGVITLLLLLTAIFADFLAPYGALEFHRGARLVPPSAEFWMGTDNMARDVFSRVILGARISVIVGLTATTLSIVTSVVIGGLSGYFGGKFDLIVQRFVDGVMCLPGLVLLMVVISMVGAGMWQVIIVLGVVWGIGGSRVIRGAVMSVKENVYVEAAKAIGCPTSRILTRHILPNVLAPIIILFSINLPALILTEASLSFLGFGIPPPAPSWGGMLSGPARSYMFPWMLIWPGLALTIVVYGVNMFGDALRDLLDPRLRGGAGRYGVRAKKETKEERK